MYSHSTFFSELRVGCTLYTHMPLNTVLCISEKTEMTAVKTLAWPSKPAMRGWSSPYPVYHLSPGFVRGCDSVLGISGFLPSKAGSRPFGSPRLAAVAAWSLGCVRPSVTPRAAACRASLSSTLAQCLLQLITKSVMLSNQRLFSLL